MYSRFTSLLALVILPMALFGQLQSPDEFLPHKLGDNFTPHHQLVDYYQHVADNSPNVQLMEYGRTNEDRPLLLATISTAANLAQIEDIRLNHLRHAGLAEGDPDPALDRAIVWLSFSVHGNEAAGSEASMGVVYDLADTADPRAQQWLENTIVLIDPSVNPDGYSRYTSWYRGVATTERDINPYTREHREPWPGGRTNHYMFDLNRDWAWQTQVESQQRIVQYHQWMPHVHADLHEQFYNNPYYFAPAAQPYHAYITEWQGDFQFEIGKNHARYFDANGWLYFTGEVFDLLYPSYGDTYPTFNGSIGMTYEQGGHSRGGCAILLPNGDTLTLHDRIAHHRTTALSTVEVSSRNAQDLVAEFSQYFDDAVNNPTGPYKTYIIRGNNDRSRMAAFLQLLDRNGIEYGRLGAPNATLSAFDYQSGESTTISVAHDDVVISAYQPRSVLTQVLLDPTTEVVDSLTYDITAWSLPYAYGLEAYASTRQIDVQEGYNLPAFRNNVSTAQPAYAYLVEWSSARDARFLGQILKAGIKVRYTSTGFQLEGKTYAPGTLVITRADNRKNRNLATTMRELARQEQVMVDPVATGFTQSGPDLGSGSMELIDAPSVAMVAGDGTFSNEAGQVWYTMEQRLDYPIHIFYPDDLDNWDTEEIDVLILPEGFYNFSEEAVDNISSWVRDGGKLIAIGYAVNSLAGHDVFGLERQSGEGGSVPTDDSYAGRERRSISHSIPGAIFSVDMDTTHPLAFGLDETYFSLKTGTMAFAPLSQGWNVGTIGDDPLVSGFVGSNALPAMKNSLVYGVMSRGQGSIVYLVDNPLYRGFWENGIFLFGNALFMVD